MTNRNLRVGDTVEVRNGAYADYAFKRGVITTVNFGNATYPIRVKFSENDFIWFTENELILIAAAAAKPDSVQHPAHYAHPSGVEVIEITKHESFLRGNIIKYVLRAPYKGNELEDMQKAAQYLQWEIERLQETTRN